MIRVVNFLWLPIKIPKKIMISGVSFLNLEPKAAERPTPRRRPLHTCGASCLAVAHKACMKLQDCDGPLGSTAKRAVAFFNSFFPFVYTVLYQWLALLSFMDDYILNVETVLEAIFPPSKVLFDKIDELVCSAEVLPHHFDEFVAKFASVLHQFPFVDWFLAHLISWLNFTISVLTHSGSKNTDVKEIRVVEKGANVTPTSDEKSSQSDSNGLNCEAVDKQTSERLHSLRNRIKPLEIEPHCCAPAESPMCSSYHSAKSSPASDWSPDATMSCSYKEVLEKGKNDDSEYNSEDIVVNEERADIAQRGGEFCREAPIY